MDFKTCNKEFLITALSMARQREIVGKQDNPEIIKMFNEAGFNGDALKDETSWCSVYVNWVAFKHNLPRSKSLTARSWLKVGHKVEDGKHEIGDIVIFSRPPVSWQGHVGFYMREDKEWIYVLGGNQSNQVKFSAYRKNRLLGYRRLTSY